MKKKFIGISLVMCILIILSGCTQTTINDDGTQNGISVTEIRICDNPSENFSHVTITLSEVKLFSNETNWVSFLSEPKIIDLMYLHRNNLTEQLGLKNISIGNFTKLLVVVDNATGILSATGDTIFFETPSDTLMIQHMFDFRKGNNTITLDINLDDSILSYHDENGTQYKLLPVLSELNVSCANGTQILFRNHERIINYANGTQIRLEDENTLQNMIDNRKPTIDIAVNGKRGKTFQFKANQSLSFNASGTVDVDNDSLTFSWDFGDNISETGPIVTHSYSKTGTYQVRLSVSDSELEDVIYFSITIIKTDSSGGGNSIS
ncbi:MAG: PKD domain-containing protein [Candidatus Thermoplasmatota archaeon]|jgi:hypothetical protein|nr:PKD domain-containing protein [Candidatus Thermoplasmatota archaeon]